MLENIERVIKSKPTIKDVAADSGVSIATVSAVIHGAEWVAEKTRQRVQHSIDTLGYRPNQVARSLKTRTSNAVGVVVSDVTDPFFIDVFRSLGRTLREHKRSLVLCDSEQSRQLGGTNFRMLLEKQVDAVVLLGDSVDEDQVRAVMQQRAPLPIVAIARDYALPGINTLLIDSEAAGFEAVMHLAANGRRRIAMIGRGDGSDSETVRPYDGYRRALQAADLPYDPFLVVEGSNRHDGGQDAMRRLLTLAKAPEAVFAHDDLTALGAMQAALEAGLRVPEDVAFVGLGNTPLAAYSYPPLSSMAPLGQAVGETAARLILEQVHSTRTSDSVRRLFPARLVVRASSALH